MILNPMRFFDELNLSMIFLVTSPSNIEIFCENPNFIKFLNPEDFRLGGPNDKLVMIGRVNYIISEFE